MIEVPKYHQVSLNVALRFRSRFWIARINRSTGKQPRLWSHWSIDWASVRMVLDWMLLPRDWSTIGSLHQRSLLPLLPARALLLKRCNWKVQGRRKNFGELVLACMQADFWKEILILQHVSRCTRCPHFCTVSHSTRSLIWTIRSTSLPKFNKCGQFCQRFAKCLILAECMPNG